MKARLVSSAETREHLEDAHRRVLSVATVQRHISTVGLEHQIEIRPYLTHLCESLADSVIGDRSAISLKVIVDAGAVPSAHAMSLGLIITELVINALKYAFPKDHPNAEVLVQYPASKTSWRLDVSDNGMGKRADLDSSETVGLGTTLVSALARQLEAHVETVNSLHGLKVSIIRAHFDSRSSEAA